jgi:hypothetical protein
MLMGCAEGTESSAKSFFDGEFKKWVVGQPNAISSTASGTPVGYSFQSVAPDEPNFMAHEPSQEIPANWKSFPAYRLNVSLKSKVGLDGRNERNLGHLHCHVEQCGEEVVSQQAVSSLSHHDPRLDDKHRHHHTTTP